MTKVTVKIDIHYELTSETLRLPGDFREEYRAKKDVDMSDSKPQSQDFEVSKGVTVHKTEAKDGALLVTFSDGSQVKTWWKPAHGYGLSGDKLDGEEPELNPYQRSALKRYFPTDFIS